MGDYGYCYVVPGAGGVGPPVERRIAVTHAARGDSDDAASSCGSSTSDGCIAVWIAIAGILLIGILAAGYAEYDDYYHYDHDDHHHHHDHAGLHGEDPATYNYYSSYVISMLLLIALVGACIMSLVAAGAQDRRMASMAAVPMPSPQGDSRQFVYYRGGGPVEGTPHYV